MPSQSENHKGIEVLKGYLDQFNRLSDDSKARLLATERSITPEDIQNEHNKDIDPKLSQLELIELDHYRKSLDFKLVLYKVIVWLSVGLITIITIAGLVHGFINNKLGELGGSLLEIVKLLF